MILFNIYTLLDSILIQYISGGIHELSIYLLIIRIQSQFLNQNYKTMEKTTMHTKPLLTKISYQKL